MQHFVATTVLEIPKLSEPSKHWSGKVQVFMFISTIFAPPATKRVTLANQASEPKWFYNKNNASQKTTPAYEVILIAPH